MKVNGVDFEADLLIDKNTYLPKKTVYSIFATGSVVDGKTYFKWTDLSIKVKAEEFVGGFNFTT